MNDNELMNRRRFFKKTAKEMLPMLGAFVAAPTVIMSTLTSCGDDCDGCEAACRDNCVDSCKSSCYESCSDSASGGGCSDCSSSCNGSSASNTCSSCANDCSSSCKETCKTSCSNTCEGSATGKFDVSSASGTIDGYEYVDLGLSVKWARYNMGASKPEGYGSYHWIDVEGTSNSFDNLWFKFKDGGVLSGTQFDNAYTKWSKKWKTPTKKECEELIKNCDFEFITYNGINGAKLTSKKNGESIFLPASGEYSRYSSKFETRNKDKFGYYFIGEVVEVYNMGGGRLEIIKFSNSGISISEVYPSDIYEYKLPVRPVTTGSGSGGSGCTGSSCSSNCANNSTGGGCTGCGSGCSTSCKTNCEGSCINGCNTLCGGQCLYSCGGSCTYVSAGSKCTSCATSCMTYCYYTCDMACSSSCMSQCIYTSK